jgi:hypothetical protein
MDPHEMKDIARQFRVFLPFRHAAAIDFRRVLVLRGSWGQRA